MKLILLLHILLASHLLYAMSDFTLVKSFGKALESTPSLATGNVSKKTIKLENIWSRKGGAKEKLYDYLTKSAKSEFDDGIIYNAQKYLSNFLIEAYDTNNTKLMREIASLYENLQRNLTEANSITFNYPVLPDDYFNTFTVFESGNGQPFIKEFRSAKSDIPKEPQAISLQTERKFKLWLNLPDSKHRLKSENIISSSQFLYAISVIIHYAVKNKLESDEVFKRFIKNYYPVAMNDHYLRWILNRGIPVGTFQAKGWGCNSGNFSHKEHVENLKHKRYGSKYFKQFTNKGYCNAYQDKDGWIALGVAHLMAAHKLKPSIIKIEDKTYAQLLSYLQSSLDLFSSRVEIEYSSSSENAELMIFDRGGMYEHSGVKYSGYYEAEFPGQTETSDSIPAPSAPKISWDISHSRRFVNFFWSFDKIVESLELDFDHKYLRKAYANNLYYNTLQKRDETKGFIKGNVYFTNYLCGNDGWYRVNYACKTCIDGNMPGVHYNGQKNYNKTASLSKTALTGGQAYFIRYNQLLYDPMKAMHEQHIKVNNENEHVTNVVDELNSAASMPESFFK